MEGISVSVDYHSSRKELIVVCHVDRPSAVRVSTHADTKVRHATVQSLVSESSESPLPFECVMVNIPLAWQGSSEFDIHISHGGVVFDSMKPSHSSRKRVSREGLSFEAVNVPSDSTVVFEQAGSPLYIPVGSVFPRVYLGVE